MSDQINVLLESLKTFWNQLLLSLPQLLAGIVLFIIGWIVARFLRKGMIKLFKLVRLDALAEKAGIESFLIKGGAQCTVVNVLANLIYWFLMFALTMAVLHSFGLDAAKELFNKILLYIPNIVVALLVLVFGTLFAKFVQGALFTYLSNIRISGAEFISNIVYWAILFLVIFITLQQLSLGGEILIAAFEMAFRRFMSCPCACLWPCRKRMGNTNS